MKKLMTALMACALCLSMMTATAFAAEVETPTYVENMATETASVTAGSNIAVLWGEMTYSKTFASFNVSSNLSKMYVSINVIGNSGVSYYAVLKNTATGKTWGLNSPTANGGAVSTTVRNIPAGTYQIFMHAYGLPASEVGVVINISK